MKRLAESTSAALNASQEKMLPMNKLLEKAIEKVKTMPEDRQVEIAELLEHVVSTSDEVYVLTEKEERLVQEALDNPSPPASKEQVRAVFDKYR